MARPNLGKLVAAKARPVGRTTGAVAAARTRFAPSPTGTIHLGSLRTALYNFLLAKSTRGAFILRLEDTDRTRLQPGAEQNIYDSLRWAGLHWDEGPVKQSLRGATYAAKVAELVEQGKAYRCFCSKERLDALAASARELWPPSTASYDRKCTHIDATESERRAAAGEAHVVRFRAPAAWPAFDDVLHGRVTALTQVNDADRRYDDLVLLKSDGMPTYHFANVVDDAAMRISHVVRGEEWIPSTPKHIALYAALGEQPPQFVHIPLLTGEGGKKLSKRKGDASVLAVGQAPDFLLPEAVVNFAALLGWAPAHARHEATDVMTLDELVARFSLAGLTKGNVQVDWSKLAFLNKQHFRRIISTDFEDMVSRCEAALRSVGAPTSRDEVRRTLGVLRDHVTSIGDYVAFIRRVQAPPSHAKPPAHPETADVLRAAQSLLTAGGAPADTVAQLIAAHGKQANPVLRFALLDGQPGVSIVEALELLGAQESERRVAAALASVHS